MRKGGHNRTLISVLLTLIMVSAPLLAAAPVLAETGGILTDQVGPEMGPKGEVDAVPSMEVTDFDFHGTCTDHSSWTISGDVTCTNSDFTISNSLTVNSGGSLTLEQNSVLRMSVSSSYWYYKIQINGEFKVMNSTVRSANSNKFYGIYVYSGGEVRYEGATIQDTYYYGTYAYGADSVKINDTDFKNGRYYGLYVGMTSGSVTNSTFSNYYYQGLYANNLMNFRVQDNTFQNNRYGARLYSFNGVMIGNTMKNNDDYGVYLYNSDPTFENNVMTGNGDAGIYAYRASEVEIKNCTIQNNGRYDYWLEAGGGTMTVKSINTIFDDAGFDVNGWGGGTSELEVYWYSNVSVTWLSDGSPVPETEVIIENAVGELYPTDLYTDENGMVEWIPLMEYREDKQGEEETSPHWVNVTGELEGREITNFTQLEVSETGDNLAELSLDDVPPPLKITSPEDNFLTNATNVTISGRTERFIDEDRPVLVSVKIGGVTYEPEVDSSGNFDQFVNLNYDGKHEFEITAADWVMNKVSTELTIRRDTENPPLEVITPKDDLLTNESVVTVSGTTEAGANITVNGAEVAVDGEGAWSTDVDLEEGQNEIKIISMDPAKNWLQRTRHVELDTKAPQLIINDPVDGFETNDPMVRVSGLTEQFAQVFLNNEPVLVAGAGFQTTYQLSEGENTLVLDAMDLAGNHNYSILTVHLDTVPPHLELYEPVKNNLLLSAETVTLKGFVDPGSTLLIDHTDVSLEGDWEYEVNLREGKNKITVEALDEVGNKITISRTVIRDTTPPMLAIFNPEDGSTTAEAQALVEGSVEPGANLTINGETVGAVGGMYSEQVELEEGENVFTFEAVDKAGNVQEKEISVFLDTMVSLDVDTSKNGTVVKKENLTIRGQTDPDGRVHINGEPVDVKGDGKFSHSVLLIEGNNTILIQAHDQFGNENHVEMDVTLKTPGGGTGTIGHDMASGGNLWIWILVLVLVVVSIAAVAGHNIMAKRKARDSMIQQEADEQTDALRQEDPDNIYQQLYDQPSSGYSPSPDSQIGGTTAPTADPVDQGQQPQVDGPQVTTATASPVDVPQYNVTEGAQMSMDEAANRIKAHEARGMDASGPRRNLRLAKQFAARGNSEKAERYASKALEELQDAYGPDQTQDAYGPDQTQDAYGPGDQW